MLILLTMGLIVFMIESRKVDIKRRNSTGLRDDEIFSIGRTLKNAFHLQIEDRFFCHGFVSPQK